MYAFPAIVFARTAPITAMPLLIATDQPKASPKRSSPAVSLAFSVMLAQPDAGLTKTYAFPEPKICRPFHCGAPASTVLPSLLIQEEPLWHTPSPSPEAPSE